MKGLFAIFVLGYGFGALMTTVFYRANVNELQSLRSRVAFLESPANTKYVVVDPHGKTFDQIETEVLRSITKKVDGGAE